MIWTTQRKSSGFRGFDHPGPPSRWLLDDAGLPLRDFCITTQLCRGGQTDFGRVHWRSSGLGNRPKRRGTHERDQHSITNAPKRVCES